MLFRAAAVHGVALRFAFHIPDCSSTVDTILVTYVAYIAVCLSQQTASQHISSSHVKGVRGTVV